jgi:hypothetical protein
MKRIALLVTSVALVFANVGCGASSGDAEPEAAVAQDQSLTTAQTRKVIEASVGPLFVDPCGSNVALTKRQVPVALRATFKAELAALKARFVADGVDARFIDDYKVYAVYTSRARRTLAGYALRVSVADGSSFSGLVAGYSTRGTRLFELEDFAQDDQDIEEPIDCR